MFKFFALASVLALAAVGCAVPAGSVVVESNNVNQDNQDDNQQSHNVVKRPEFKPILTCSYPAGKTETWEWYPYEDTNCPEGAPYYKTSWQTTEERITTVSGSGCNSTVSWSATFCSETVNYDCGWVRRNGWNGWHDYHRTAAVKIEWNKQGTFGYGLAKETYLSEDGTDSCTSTWWITAYRR